MTSYSVEFVNNNFNKILNEMDAGTLSSVSIMETHTGTTAGTGTVVGKIVTPAAFNTANTSVGNTAILLQKPQAPFAGAPNQLGTDGLYQLLHTVNVANALVDNNVKAVYAYLTGDGIDGLTFTAVQGGTGGNGITVALTDPGAPGATLGVVVTVKAIVVNLGTDGSSNISSTLTQIAAILNTTAESAALISTAVVGTGSVTPESTKAAITITQSAGGTAYTADTKGTAGNAITVTYVNPTVAGHAHYSYPDGVQGGNGIDFTAVATGTGGDVISITVVVSGLNTALSVGVVGNAITINLATNGGGAATSTLTQVKTAYDLVAAATALATTAVTGAGGTTATAMAIQNLTSDFAISVSVVSSAITVNLATDVAGVITTTQANIKTAVDGSGPAAALVDTVTTGVGSTLAVAVGATHLAGGTDDGTLVATHLAGGATVGVAAQQFQAIQLFRTAAFANRPGITPSNVIRAVLISKSHADYLGL